jgi:photosystem II stability/assembly factor-like uncharacterized protein
MKRAILFFLTIFSLTIIVLLSCEKPEPPIIPILPKTAGWNPIVLNIRDTLNDIYFVNENTGWIVGENQLLLSTTSGNDGWSFAPVDLPLENLRSVFFIDDQLGWIGGDLSGNMNKGQVGYSGIGGGYPVQLGTFPNPINSLFFTDTMTGWLAGDGGLLAKTQDGGYKWQIIPLLSENAIRDIHFLDGNSGWAVADKGEIFHTENGLSWEKVESGIETDILAVHFIDNSHGWACGANNTILMYQISDTSSSSWFRTTIENEFTTIIWNDIYFIDSMRGWIVGEFGNIYKTIDGGITWEKENSNVNSTLNAIHMVSASKGWIVGEDGIIMSYGSG